VYPSSEGHSSWLSALIPGTTPSHTSPGLGVLSPDPLSFLVVLPEFCPHLYKKSLLNCPKLPSFLMIQGLGTPFLAQNRNLINVSC
jgi:hypothetical protein